MEKPQGTTREWDAVRTEYAILPLPFKATAVGTKKVVDILLKSYDPPPRHVTLSKLPDGRMAAELFWRGDEKPLSETGATIQRMERLTPRNQGTKG